MTPFFKNVIIIWLIKVKMRQQKWEYNLYGKKLSQILIAIFRYYVNFDLL